jgi:hypothetical protein
VTKRSEEVEVRLLFVDEGSYHHEDVRVAAGLLDEYERLIDLLQEEPSVLKQIHVDLSRLCFARIVTD